MRSLIKFLTSLSFTILFSFYVVNALPNPAALYCKDLGYNYRIDMIEKGERGICVFSSKIECEEWQFFKGRCGQEYSYCARQGYLVETVTSEKEPYHEYAVCVDKITKQKIGSVTDLMNFKERLSNYELKSYTKDLETPKYQILSCHDSDGLDFYTKGTVTFDSKTYIDNCVNDEVLIEGYCDNGFKTTTYYCPSGCSNGACFGNFAVIEKKMETTTSLPTYWDWSHEVLPWAEPKNGEVGEPWATPVKNQGACDSCYVFSPIGAQEAKINILSNDPYYDPNLSEQDIVSCFKEDCDTGLEDHTLDYIKNTGVVDEGCFPYTSEDGTVEPCSNKCSGWSRGLWQIDYVELPQSLTEEEIQQYLITYGPLVTRMYYPDPDLDPEGFPLSCKNPVNHNHAVVIVGYNNFYNYWIVKNSWGADHGINGYFLIAYGQCNVWPRFYIEEVISSCCGWKCGSSESFCCCYNPTNENYYWRQDCCNSGEIKKNPSSCEFLMSCDETCENSGLGNYGFASKDACCCKWAMGCPYLKVWDGQEFVTLEKLGIHEEEGVDAEVQTAFTMKPIQDGKYKMILKEASYLSLDDDGSNIDYVKLTTQDGQECKLLSAIHEKEGDVVSEIKDSDDVRIRTEPDEEIVLEYECYGNDFVFTIEGHNPRHPYLKLASGYINNLINAVKGLLGIN